MVMEEERRAIVLDVGSGFTKVGWAGEEQPSHVFLSIIGRPRYPPALLGPRYKEFYVGEEALRLRGVMRISYPLEHGIIRDWDGFKKLVGFTFGECLKVDPSKHPVLLTEAPLNPRDSRERMAEIMFEDFRVPRLYVAMQALAAAYAVGKLTGLIVDMGDGVCHAVPVYEGFVLRHAIQRTNIGGRDITNYLSRLLMHHRGVALTTTAEKEIVRDIKEKLCYVSVNPEAELAAIYGESERVKEYYAGAPPAEAVKPEPAEYTLPDGSSVTLLEERFLAPEVLFSPGLIGRDEPGLHEIIFDAIMACDIDVRKDMIENIVLTGGSSMFPGLKERVEKEVNDMLADAGIKLKANVITPENRQYAVWIGCSRLASLPEFQRSWIEREEYEREGPAVIHRTVRIGAIIPYFGS
ncbi:MAG TPA: actin, cytoplasmic 2 [Candidatus Bathyarchaeota archaeon]|nr:MAG: actin, cytoplasmic 2 [Candidatus Bathyarchaeota archaeon]HDJ26158.1 actin, cytoplasmic 2 [Candidatus Bathyarchaeota archaeon]